MSTVFGIRAGSCPVPTALLRAMTANDIVPVEKLERMLHPFPWTPGIFADSLRAGYDAQVLMLGEHPIAYWVAMKIVDEIHLLNLSVSAAYQRRRVGRWLLAVLLETGREQGIASVLLEVRRSNEAAQALYRGMGFEPIGLRHRYYPSLNNSREDAIVMRSRLDA